MSKNSKCVTVYVPPKVHAELQKVARQEGISMNQLVIYLLAVEATISIYREIRETPLIYAPDLLRKA